MHIIHYTSYILWHIIIEYDYNNRNQYEMIAVFGELTAGQDASILRERNN